MKIKLTNAQQELLYLGEEFTSSRGDKYYMNVNIYKRVDEINFEEIRFKSLPEGIKKFIINNWIKDIKEYIKTTK